MMGCSWLRTGTEATCGAKGAQVEMAMGTRNPSTRWVLPDKDAGMERILYPWVRYWVKFSTHRVWRVRVWNSSTHTRIPVGKKYP
jgi:hypothetical protein